MKPLTMLLFPLIALAPAVGRAQTSEPVGATGAPQATQIRDRAALERLLGNSGLTLQWISWDERGEATADYSTDLLRLKGRQVAANGRGRLELDGVVTEIGRDHFTFIGRIDIIDTPDLGRACHREGPMTFRITQNRRYWRLQEMEVCDGLTDYVDIYF